MVRINLLPVRVSKKKEAGKQQLVLFALVLVAGVLANGFYHQHRVRALAVVERDLKKTKDDIAALDKVIQDVDKIKAEEAMLKKKLETLDALRKGRTGPVRMLSELAENMPRRLWLKKMEEKSSRVAFTGSAASIEDVSEFIRKLRESKYFAQVELKRILETKAGAFRVVDFEISSVGKYTPGQAVPEADAAKRPGAKRKG
ncbi:MAG TPA: PilN domain-containing protein [Anaeromyxobacter sp.]|nr:PilN domain-containing protein [Anaeromyxobacter sp.]